MHYRTDLLTDEQLSQFKTKVGDKLLLDVPQGEGKFAQTECLVSNIEITDIGAHPETGEHLTRVTLALD